MIFIFMSKLNRLCSVHLYTVIACALIRLSDQEVFYIISPVKRICIKNNFQMSALDMTEEYPKQTTHDSGGVPTTEKR